MRFIWPREGLQAGRQVWGCDQMGSGGLGEWYLGVRVVSCGGHPESWILALCTLRKHKAEARHHACKMRQYLCVYVCFKEK
mgnify:CR=1 FL=1